MIAYVAFGLVAVIAATSWRWSRRIALACVIAFAAGLAYLVHPAEPLRWVSALVGLAGVVELGSAASAAVRAAKTPREAFAAMERRGWLGLLCFASMASDGVAMLSWRLKELWPMPYTQIGWSLLLIAVGAWPARRS